MEKFNLWYENIKLFKCFTNMVQSYKIMWLKKHNKLYKDWKSFQYFLQYICIFSTLFQIYFCTNIFYIYRIWILFFSILLLQLCFVIISKHIVNYDSKNITNFIKTKNHFCNIFAFLVHCYTYFCTNIFYIYRICILFFSILLLQLCSVIKCKHIVNYFSLNMF